MKKFLCTLLSAAMILSLAGCNESKPLEENKEGATSVEEIKASFLKKADEVTVSEDDVTFTDAFGKEITIKKNPAKPVSLYASFSTLWYESGGKLAGTIGGKSASSLYKEYIGRDITEDEGMEILSTSGSAKKWDIEKIISFMPDLIICSTAMGGYETIKGPAEAVGIPVIAVDYEDFSDYLKWFRVFSAINGNDDLWEEIALKSLDRVAKIISLVPSENNPRIFSMFVGPKELQANTSATLSCSIASDLKAENIVDKWDNKDNSTRLTINLETVVASDPDIILVQSLSSEEEGKEMLQKTYGDNEVWNSLRAVKEGKVFFLQKELFHNKPNSKFADAYKVLFDILYPAK